MPAAIVHKKQTSGAAATLAITSATANNLLVAFIMQTASTGTPTGKDNISGTAGWTVNATSALQGASANSLWVATKPAVGGETELNPTAGVGGTIVGICCFETSGLSATVDTIVHADNTASAKTAVSPAVTTTDAGDMILAAVGFNEAIGVVSAWSGTGPMTNVETASTRALGGSYIPGVTVSGATFTANWETARTSGMLVVAFKPSVNPTINKPADQTSTQNVLITPVSITATNATSYTSTGLPQGLGVNGGSGGVSIPSKPETIGLAEPAGGWKLMFGDRFAVPFGTGAGENNRWYLNRFSNLPAGENQEHANVSPPNELAVFNSNQIARGVEGAELSVTRVVGEKAGSQTANYVGAYLQSVNRGTMPAGYEYFNFKLGQGDVWAFEFVCKFPVNTGEMNNGMWATSGGGWKEEFDFWEAWGWNDKQKGTKYNGGCTWIAKGEEGGIVQGEQQLGLKFDPSAAFHRYTVVVFANNTFSMYVDGVLQKSVGSFGSGIIGPAAPNNVYQGLILQNTLRDFEENFTSGARKFLVSSVAVYNNTGLNVLGAGLAPGTVAEGGEPPTITGIPTTAEAKHSVTLTAHNAGGEASTSFNWTVAGVAPTVTNPGAQTAKVGGLASLAIQATAATEYEAVGLPAGLSINPTTGVISGVFTAAEASAVTVTVTGAGGKVTATFGWTVTGQVAVRVGFGVRLIQRMEPWVGETAVREAEEAVEPVAGALETSTSLVTSPTLETAG